MTLDIEKLLDKLSIDMNGWVRESGLFSYTYIIHTDIWHYYRISLKRKRGIVSMSIEKQYGLRYLLVYHTNKNPILDEYFEKVKDAIKDKEDRFRKQGLEELITHLEEQDERNKEG